MRGIVKPLVAGLAIIGAILSSSSTSYAQSWTTHRLAEATFEAPEGWAPTSSRGDRTIILADPSGRELRVEWWLQDEPFLGYSDIVSHKRIILGGKRATWRHSSFSSRQSIAAVVDEKRKDRRQLLIVLEVPGRDPVATIRLFDEILARVRFGKAGEKSGAPAGPPAPARAAPVLQKPAALSPQMKAAAAHFDRDCEAVDPAAWNHPALAAIRKRKQARLQWAMLCRNRSLPVLGMSFEFDPRGQTGDFFLPLYGDALQSGTEAAFSFVSLRDGLIIDLTRQGKDEIGVDYREAPELADAERQHSGARASDTAMPVAAGASTPAPDRGDTRLFLARTSFSAPMEWEIRADPDQSAIGFIRPDGKAEIMVLLWPVQRPLSDTGIEQLEHVVVADAPAIRYRQKIAGGAAEHVFFEEGYADGSRISVSYRALGEPIEDGTAIFELFLADLKLNDSPPGGWTPAGAPLNDKADPFAGLDPSNFEKSR